MTFWFAPFSDLIKKKVCRYLLHRYLGSYIDEKISLDQLNVDFYNGTGTISDIVLSPQALNELCESQGWDIEVTAGHIGQIDVNIPWNALMSEDSFIELTDLYFELRPKSRPKDGASMIESMWSSMSSSMQLAKDCLEHEGNSGGTGGGSGSAAGAQNPQMEGLERFAQIIDNVLNRIKVRLNDTEIRLDYFTVENERGVTLIAKIKRLDYKNEAGGDPPDKPPNAPDESDENGPAAYSIPVYSTHQITMENVTFYMEEFRIASNGQRVPMAMAGSNTESMLVASEQFYSTINELPEPARSRQKTPDETSEDDDDDDTDEPVPPQIYRTDALQIARFHGVMDLRITMKQAVNVQGPKVQLELQLGAVNVFVTPRQLHALIYLSNIFLEDTSAQQTNPRADDPADDLEPGSQYKQFNAMSGHLGFNQGWSSDPMYDPPNQMSVKALEVDTIRESQSQSMTNSVTSFGSGYTQTTIRNRRRGVIEVDPNADILRLNIRVACCAIVLLQEDILVESSSNDEESPLSEDSLKKLKSISDTFFETIDDICVNSGAKDLNKIVSLLDKGCKKNHLRLIAAPIIIEGEEQRNNSGILLRLSLSIPRADFREILKDASIPLLEFYRDTSSGALPKRPEISVVIKQTTTMSGTSDFSTPKTEINFTLSPCLSEIDISIWDRLNAVFNGDPFDVSSKQGGSTDEHNLQRNAQPKVSFVIESSSIDIRLRFPCTDLRPIHTTDRVPWWKRNVLRDSIYVNLCQAKFVYLSPSKYDIVANKIDLYYSENDDEAKIHIGNCVTLEQPAKKYAQPVSESPKISIELPSIQTIVANLQKQQPSDDSSDGGLHSDFGFHLPKPNEPTPFSAKHVWRESDTPHSKTDDGTKSTQNITDDEKLLMPGDITEMSKFCDDAEKTSRLKINISLPIVSFQLRSKHMYEVIYNRIISNLLLWTPSAPVITPKVQPPSVDASILQNVGMSDSVFMPFSMAKSNIIFESSSATNSDSDSETENIFYSTYHENKRPPQPKAPQPSTLAMSSACSFKLTIGQGMLTMYSPVRDSANRVIPGQLGEFVMKAQNGHLFSVSSYRGNESLNYMCVQAASAEVYHLGLVPVPPQNPPLRCVGCVLPSHVQSTLYPTPDNLTVNQSTGKKVTNREMISIAVQIKSLPERKVKRVKVSAGIQLATLRYNSTSAEHSWLHQIMDIFNVEDYPIQGYTPLTNITEMHLHLWDCSVDYRPRFFDYRAILGINTFMISTTVASASTGCTVRFVAEDGTLSIAPQTPPGEFKLKHENRISSLPSDDLVCVFEFALLEISLRESDKATEFAPKYDVRAAMNGTHMRVCSDSCMAFGNLIAYMAAEGDLAPKCDGDADDSESLMSSREMTADLLAVNAQNVPEVSEDQQQRVNQLMEEAMQDCIRAVPSKSSGVDLDGGDDDAEIFYFPDEAQPNAKKHESVAGISSRKLSQVSRSSSSLNRTDGEDDASSNITDCSRRQTTDLQDIIDFETSIVGLKSVLESECTEAIPQVVDELGVIAEPTPKVTNRRKSSDTDEDFCFIGDEERPRYGFDNVVPTDEPIRIVDNHFSIPLDKHDMLKAPPGFPQAVTRYTICDLSISMHLYGGNDFPNDKEHTEKEYEKPVISTGSEGVRMSEAYKKGVAFSKISSTVTLPGKITSSTPRSQRPWKERGGVNRNFEVLVEIHSSKGRFSHETYPAHTREASRQVLVLSEFEVWDRLACSSFHKMFYTGRSERSKKSDQATMYIKCIFIRPEPTLPSQEANLFISFMPKVNINIDQDAMLFIADFFAQLNGSGDEEVKPPRQTSTPTHQPPVMIVDMPEVQEMHARKMVDQNLMLLIDDEEEKEKPAPETTAPAADNSPVYFRSVTFSPEVELTINYCGKRVQMSHGPIIGLIMGLSQLNCSKIKLKKINYRRGLLGIDRVLHYLVKEWLNHIKNRQLPSLLQGIGPMNSIVIFFQGVIDLFRLPYEQYQRDGRIVRGIQLGAQSFTSRTAVAALELTTRLIYLLQVTAETAYDMVSPGPSVKITRGRRRGKRKLHRPQDIREGVTNAYYIVKDGVGDTAHAIVELAAIEHDQKGVTGAVGAVIRQIPPTMVKPLVLATQATTNVLGGVRNQLVPDARIEAKEKWKEDDD